MLDTIQVKALPWLLTSHQTWNHPSSPLLKNIFLYITTNTYGLSTDEVNTHALSGMYLNNFILYAMAKICLIQWMGLDHFVNQC